MKRRCGTTTIRIEDDLKTRIAVAAERAGKSAHAFIVEAIAQKVEQIEAEEELRQVAQKRWAKVLQTGKSVSWEDAKLYVAERSQGRPAARPSTRKLG